MNAIHKEDMLEIRSLVKQYALPDGTVVEALRLPKLTVRHGESVLIEGVSGSGKTTLLHLLALLYTPTAGKILFEGTDLTQLSNSARDSWRAKHVGYIFQSMNLLPEFNALENLLIAAAIAGVPKKLAEEKGFALLEHLGLGERARHRPAQLSLGEQQRVAAARAVIHDPLIVLADEPTASLDAENSLTVMNLLRELTARSGSSLIVCTHDNFSKKSFDRTVRLEQSRIRFKNQQADARA